MDRPVVTYLVVESALLATYLGVGAGLTRALIWQAMIWLTVVVIGASIRRHLPAAPRPWVVMLTGIGLLGIGALADPALGVVVAVPASLPLFELATAIGFPLIGVGALGFARAQSRGRDRGPVLDSLIVTIALTTALWEAAMNRHEPSFELAGELMILMIVGATASWVTAMNLRAFLAGGYEAASGWAMLGSALLVTAGAAVFVWEGVEVAGTATPPVTTAVMWVVALMLLGVAAMHPSMRWLTEPQEVESAHTITRTVLAGVALITPPVAIVVRWLTTGETAVVATVASLVIAVIVVARFADLVRDREQARDELQRQSLHDPLTGLPNRTLLDDRLGQLLVKRTQERGTVGVAFLDLDGFKAVNDRLGHAAGDDLLRQLAARMRAACRPGDTLARFGGDEFVLVLEDTDEVAALERCHRLLEVVATPVELGSELAAVGASIGLALETTTGGDPERLLVAADDAMYRAKRDGRGRVRLAGPADARATPLRDRRAEAR